MISKLQSGIEGAQSSPAIVARWSILFLSLVTAAALGQNAPLCFTGVGTISPSAGWSLAAGAFNRGGTANLVAYHPSDGSVWLGTWGGSAFSFGRPTMLSPAAGWNMVTGDVDGDGKANLVLYHPSDGSVWVGTWGGSTFSFSRPTMLSPAAGWSMATGDFYGDRKAYLVAYHPSDGSVWVGTWGGAAFSFSRRTTLLPAAGWSLVAGDFDGNDKAELAAFHPSDGSLWVGPLLTVDSRLQHMATLPATAGPSLTPGDFNGDGKIDLAACNAADGNLLVALSGNQSFTWSWASVRENAAFPPLDGGGALVFGGRMWLLGGWQRSTLPRPYTTNSIWDSTNGVDWTWRGAAPWESRHTAGYAVHDGKMWIVGGDANSGHYQNDVWQSADGVHWNRVASDVPWRNRVLHHVVAFNGKIWVMGGQKLPLREFFPNGPTDEMLYNDVWNTTDGIHWTRVLEHAPWAPRGMIGGSVVFNNRMWLLGGGTYETPQHPERNYYNDVWSTSDGVKWTRVSPNAPWEPRQYHDVAVFNNRMWVLEGYHGRNLNDVWSSCDGVTWVQLPGTPWSARHAASVFVHDNALWMVAGNLWNDVWRLGLGSK